LTFAASNCDDRAAVAFFKLTLSHRNRFYAAIDAGSNMPENIHIRPSALVVKLW